MSDNGRLEIIVGSNTMNFIDDINPVDSAEATGVVTRFTINQSNNSSYPVSVRLLSVIDVISIVAEGYLSEISGQNSTTNSYNFVQEAHESDGFNGVVDENEIKDLENYLISSFPDNYNIIELSKALFWSNTIKNLAAITSSDASIVIGFQFYGMEMNIC